MTQLIFLIAFICAEKRKCVVPENIHTPTTEGIGNSGGVGGGVKRPGKSRGEGG